MNEKLKEWIQNGITDEAVDWANKFGEKLASRDNANRLNPMTTAQLRKFFGEIRRIDADLNSKLDDLPMLKPMLAYAVGRDRDGGVHRTKIGVFEKEITAGIDVVLKSSDKKSSFKNFLKLVEAIVAYHKFHGGK